MTNTTFEIAKPSFVKIKEDELSLTIAEVHKDLRNYIAQYEIEKDELFFDAIFKNFETELLEKIRKKITYELRNRRRKNNN